MRISHIVSGAVMVALVASTAFAATEDRPFTGTSAQLPPELRPFVRVSLGGISGYGGASQAVQDVLALERRTTSVDQAIAVKRSGLMAASTLDDFLALCSYAFSNPSDNYRSAVSHFIAQNASGRITPVDDLSKLLALEARTTTVDDAMATKRAALAVVHDLPRFEVLSRNAFSNPSSNYEAARSQFITANLLASCPPESDPSIVLTIEARTTTVDHAMAVKSIGMQAVHDVSQFEVLTRNAFSSPSSNYEASRSRFIATRIAASLSPVSDISVILQIEARTTTVDDAIAVKTAALVAVHTRDDLTHLARSAFSSPSAQYLQRVGEFVAHAAGNIAGAPHP